MSSAPLGRLRIALVAAIAVTLPALAYADDPAPSKPKPKAKDREGDSVVVTGTRTPERAQRATVKTDVITREEADRRGATNVAEALATQPGLVVNPGSYGFLGGVSALQIQGFDRDRVLILEDNERVIGDVGGAIDLSTIPTGDIDRIEVVSGPTSALYGSSALGGVVNIITGPPRLEGPTGRVKVEGRSLNGVVLQGNAAYRKGAPWAAVDFQLTRMDGIEKNPGPDLQVPETAHRMFGLRAGMSLTPDIDVKIRARQFRDRTEGLESQTVPGLGRFLIDTPVTSDRYALHLVETTRIGSKGSNLRLSLGSQWFASTNIRDRRDSPIDEEHDSKQRLNSFEATGTIADGPRTYVMGARAEAEHYEQNIVQTASTSGGLSTVSMAEVTPLSYGIGALYGQVQWKFGDLTVMPGVRFESHTRYGASVAPRLAAAWHPSDMVTLRASGGRGFRAPSAKELGFAFDHSAFGYKIFGNDALRPETSWGINADITVTPSSTLTLRGSAYANWVDNLIDIDLGNGRAEAGIVSYTYTNFGRARTAGGQVDATLKPAPFLRVESSYAYAWTRDDVNDQPLPGRPPHSVTLAVRIEPGWKLELYARARIVTNSFLDENTRAPGYENFDVRAGRELWQKSQLYVGALNVTDVKQDPGRIGDTRSPLGRILYVGLKADFPWEDE